jgi:hypothetical protein
MMLSSNMKGKVGEQLRRGGVIGKKETVYKNETSLTHSNLLQ